MSNKSLHFLYSLNLSFPTQGALIALVTLLCLLPPTGKNRYDREWCVKGGIPHLLVAINMVPVSNLICYKIRNDRTPHKKELSNKDYINDTNFDSDNIYFQIPFEHEYM